MKVTFRDAKILTDESGVWLCLKPEEAAPCRGFVLGRKDRRYDAEIREHRDRRSNDANAYYWALAGKLAQAIGQPPESVLARLRSTSPRWNSAIVSAARCAASRRDAP